MLEYAARGPAERYETVEDARRIVHEMLAFPLPIVAAVNGRRGPWLQSRHVLRRCAMSGLAYFADPHVTVGLVAADGGVLTWPVMTISFGRRIHFDGDRIDAANAFRMGLTNHVLAFDELLPRANARRSFSISAPASAGRDKARSEHSSSSGRDERA